MYLENVLSTQIGVLLSFIISHPESDAVTSSAEEILYYMTT
jgi:hypothetical protein